MPYRLYKEWLSQVVWLERAEGLRAMRIRFSNGTGGTTDRVGACEIQIGERSCDVDLSKLAHPSSPWFPSEVHIPTQIPVDDVAKGCVYTQGSPTQRIQNVGGGWVYDEYYEYYPDLDWDSYCENYGPEYCPPSTDSYSIEVAHRFMCANL